MCDNTLRRQYETLGITAPVYEYGMKILETLEERFQQIDRTAEYNQLKA